MKIMEILAIILLVRYIITIIVMVLFADLYRYSVKQVKEYRKDGLYITLFPLFYLSLMVVGYIAAKKHQNKQKLDDK